MNRAVRNLLPIVLLTLIGCADPNAAKKQQLRAELARIEARFALINQQALATAEKAHFLAQRHIELEAELADFRGRVQAYMMNHKLAVVALAFGFGGSAVAIDANNEFTSDQRLIGGIAAGVAALYAWGNMSEVIAVADQLAQADQHAKSLAARLADTELALTTEQTLLAKRQQELASLEASHARQSRALQALL